MSVLELMQKHRKSAAAIVDKATAEKRDLTAEELKSFEHHEAEFKSLEARVDAASDTSAKLNGAGGGDVQRLSFKGATGKAFARHAATEIVDGIKSGARGMSAKAGSAHVLPVWASGTDEVVRLGEPVRSLIQAFEVDDLDSSHYVFPRQTVRELNAGVVPAGETKPVSKVTVEPVESQLHVIAHTSEPFDRFLLEDSAGLQRFIAAEMQLGIEEALEGLIVAGSGTGEPAGILSVTGVRQIAFVTDPLVSLRRAKTTLQVAGYEPDLFVMSPNDWEAIETMRDAEERFALGGPVNAAAQQLWDLPVALSNAVADGEAFALDSDALRLKTDKQGIRIDWDGAGELFDKNQVRMRVEGRFDVAIGQPGAIAVVELAAA